MLRCACFRVTHWEQTAIFLKEPIAVKLGDKIAGSIALSPNSLNERLVGFVIIHVRSFGSSCKYTTSSFLQGTAVDLLADCYGELVN
jgi:hypothetical protein